MIPGDRPHVVMALCGKGGVGKTSLAAMITALLLRIPGRRVLAIDADPAQGLTTALDLPARKTVDDIRQDLIARTPGGTEADPRDTLARLDYELLEALAERDNLALLAIGRPEADGCYCQVNQLLRDLIAALARHFDVVVIDSEAGVEQVNRRVMERVSHLILVSDLSVKGLQVAATVQALARRTVGFRRAGLVLNRLRGPDELARACLPEGLNLVGWIPESKAIREADIAGGSFLDASAGLPLDRVEDCLLALGLGREK